MSYDTASNQRKQQLACALKEMLQTKPLSKISISDLIRHCNINRKTFYYHFEDIFSLLEWTLQQETIELLKHYNIFTDYNNAIGFVIDYVEANYSMLSNIYNSMGHHQLQLFFSQNVKGLIEALIDDTVALTNSTISAEYRNFLISFYTEAISGMITYKLFNRPNYDRETLISYIFNTFHSGILATLKDASENNL